MYSTLKRRGNGRFHAVSTWNTRGTFLSSISLSRQYSGKMTKVCLSLRLYVQATIIKCKTILNFLGLTETVQDSLKSSKGDMRSNVTLLGGTCYNTNMIDSCYQVNFSVRAWRYEFRGTNKTNFLNFVYNFIHTNLTYYLQ